MRSTCLVVAFLLAAACAETEVAESSVTPAVEHQ